MRKKNERKGKGRMNFSNSQSEIKNSLSRRQFIKKAGAFTLGTSLFFRNAPTVWAQKDKFKIGGVLTFTGAHAPLGIGLRRGAEFAVKEHGGKILGREVEFMWGDDEMKPMVAVEKTKKFISDKANLIFGAVASGATYAISDLCRTNKVIQLVTISTLPEITSKGHRYVFRTVEIFFAEELMVSYTFKEKGFKSLYLLGSDTQVGRDSSYRIAKAIKGYGAKVYDPVFHPLGHQDFTVFIHKILESKPEALCYTGAGLDPINFIKQAAQFDLHKKMFVFGSSLMDDNDVKALGDIALGMETPARYSWNYDIPPNRVFVEKFNKEYGELPTAWEGEAYDGMMWFIKTVNETDSMNVEKWVDAFEKSIYKDSVHGPKIMRECDHQASQVGLWARASRTKEYPFPYLKVVKVYPPEILYEPCSKNPGDWPSKRT